MVIKTRSTLCVGNRTLNIRKIEYLYSNENARSSAGKIQSGTMPELTETKSILCVGNPTLNIGNIEYF